MSYPAIAPSPEAPVRVEGREDYAAVADAFAAYIASMPAMYNSLAEWIGDTAASLTSQGFSGTSSTSLTIGTGVKTLIASTGAAFVGGQSVVIASVANPANSMTGTVVSYDSETGEMEVNVGSVSGSGTFANWTIGLALVADLSGYLQKAGGTMTGLLTLAAALGLVLTPGSAPSSKVDGHVWRETGKLMVRIGSTDYEVGLIGRTQTDSNKTFTSPTINGGTISAPTVTGDIFLNGRVRGPTISSGGATLDCSTGNHFTRTVSGNITFAFTNVPANSYACLLEIDWSAGTVTLPTGTKTVSGKAIKWATGKWWVVLSTADGGTNWQASAIGPFA